MKAFVVDLETLGTGEAAHILSIGAVCVDLNGQAVISEFQCVMGADDQQRQIDRGTLDWWEKQESEAKAQSYEADPNNCIDLRTGLIDFKNWMERCVPDLSDRQLFGNGPEFDNKILEHAYKEYDISAPWKYSNNQSIRTMALIGKQCFYFDHHTMPFEGVKHSALDDAKHEAKVLMRVWQDLMDQL